MDIGMLWEDNDPKTDLAAKIAGAAEYYRKKYGQSPNLCFIHPSMLGDKPIEGPIEVRTSKSVLPNHLWIGVEQKGQCLPQ